MTAKKNITYVSGHRNPDVDSITSAAALADLRARTGTPNVVPICPGMLPERASVVFKKFGLPPPVVRSDVYVRVINIIDHDVPSIPSDITLLEALRRLEASGESSLPVFDVETKVFRGMLSPAKLLSLFISKADLSIPVSAAPLHACAQILNADDRVHDIRPSALRNAHNHFPVVMASSDGTSSHFVGTVLKRAFAEPPPFSMILVDHNEIDQGIPGLEELPVIEVVDHHRIAFARTTDPIRYTADAVGSTCTLVTRMFRAAGLRPVKPIAGILLAGIVADTLLFQSPTTTESDTTAATWLEKLCGASARELMDVMMSVASPIRTQSAEAAIASDRKTYCENHVDFALSQIEVPNFALFRARLDEFVAALEKSRVADHLAFAALLVTDPVRGDSQLIFAGDEAVRRALPWRRDAAGVFLLPGVLSRKKQLLPEILTTLS